VLDLADGMETYRDVPTLVAQAKGELSSSQGILEQLADAYAGDNWERVIQLARQLGTGAPLEVATWVQRAWREVRSDMRVLTGHTDRVYGVAALPDGQHAISGSLDHTLRLWDLATGETLRAFTGHTGVYPE
jgi:WD40 repeat protein